MFTATTATKKIKGLNKRIRLVAGGTSASKTISILLYLAARASSDFSCSYCHSSRGCKLLPDTSHNDGWLMTPTLTSIVSESFPHLRRGAMRDFLTILEQHGYFDAKRWSKTDYTYTFETGSKIEFFSADQPGKVRGPRRDRLFVNEANNITKEAWEQLLLRTREFAFADWNPVSDFYMYEDYGLSDEPLATTTDPDADFIILTYRDNESLEAAIVNEIEKRRANKQWFRVYGDGKRGELEGRIYKGWQIIDEIPFEARLVSRGLDFGFSVDPAVLVDCYLYNGGFILDERFYRTGMKNNDIGTFISNLPEPSTLVIADAAEPKSIEEVQQYGVNIIGSMKGQGARNRRIDYVQQQRISVTKRSTNLIRSYRNYMWKSDKDGNFMREPDHYLSDGMDAAGYAIESQRPQEPTHQKSSSGNLMKLFGA